jgi:hypothetical protein
MAMEETGSLWERQPAGTNWVLDQVKRFRQLNTAVSRFETLLLEQTGGRLFDWIDHFCVTDGTGLTEAGFTEVSQDWFQHPGAVLPDVHVTSFDRMLLRVDSVSDFVTANRHRFRMVVEGDPLDLHRIAVIDNRVRARLGVIERHGCTARCDVTDLSDEGRIQLLQTREALRHRPRRFGTDDDAFAFTEHLIRTAVDEVGRDVACDSFFQGERDYWMARNQAARIQLMRQNALGLGWGNHDHHTYRSSRGCFTSIVKLLELLGFTCRERFYAGREAGWGAQVLEHSTCGIVIFADVDLTPDEVECDFAHDPLPPRDSLGTIGLWCALHGEAIFDAGLHHLECQFDFDRARSQLEAMGVNSMPPFTDFPFLRQCFTEGEYWAVSAGRIKQAVQNKWINSEQASRFEKDGVVGSHLEILERNDGYRGFNQTGINQIIQKTDPRTLTQGV